MILFFLVFMTILHLLKYYKELNLLMLKSKYNL